MGTDIYEARPASGRSGHRASYILERGRWTATCRGCGWQATSAKRQVAASMFRLHIQSMRVAPVGNA
jgi:hypothetical protein